VANYFARRLPLPEGSADLGVSFEQFIIQEVRAYLSYSRSHKGMTYWRTRGYDVDLIVGQDIAIEIKFSRRFKPEYLDGLLALKEEKLIKKFYVVGRFPTSGALEGIEYLNYEIFLKKLWQGELLK
jgi:hypothetical protein